MAGGGQAAVGLAGSGVPWTDGATCGTYLVPCVHVHAQLHQARESGAVALVCRLPDRIASLAAHCLCASPGEQGVHV
eukprot:scaffold33790_cov60-Phaeocystis_antarctica.AAC.6